MTIAVFYGLHGIGRDDFETPAEALAHLIDLETGGAKYVYAEDLTTSRQYNRAQLAELAGIDIALEG